MEGVCVEDVCDVWWKVCVGLCVMCVEGVCDVCVWKVCEMMYVVHVVV